MSNKTKVEGTIETSIPDITAILDIDLNWFKTKLHELTFSVSKETKFEAQLKYTAASTGYDYGANGGYILTSNPRASFDSGRFELGRIPIPIVAGLSFDLVFSFVIDAKGTLSIGYTIETTMGFQYKQGTFRILKGFADSLDFLELKGSAKAGLAVTGMLTALGLLDLMGITLERGAALDASFTAHILATAPLYCGDVTLYAYAKLLLDKENLLGEILDAAGIELEYEILKNNASNPYKLKLHVENMKRVPECTFGRSGINGLVARMDNRMPLKDARIRVYNGEVSDSKLIRTLYSNAEGKFSIDNLAEETYTIVVSATGYQTFQSEVTLKRAEMTYVESLLMVDRLPGGQTGTILGRVTDAVTGNGISGANYALRKGWNNTSGASERTGTFTTDQVKLDLIGNYTLQVSKAGYITNSINVAAKANASTPANISLSPEGAGPVGGSLRIVLTWGENPLDLDSHLIAGLAGSPLHVYFSAQEHYIGGNLVADLDVDDTSSYGPETTTILDAQAYGKYGYYIHDYSNRDDEASSELSRSGARVQVYISNRLAATYHVPASRGGTIWHVFDYDTVRNALTPVNTLSYGSEPSDVGMMRARMVEPDTLDTSRLSSQDGGLSEADALELIVNSATQAK